MKRRVREERERSRNRDTRSKRRQSRKSQSVSRVPDPQRPSLGWLEWFSYGATQRYYRGYVRESGKLSSLKVNHENTVLKKCHL